MKIWCSKSSALNSVVQFLTWFVAIAIACGWFGR